MKKSLFISAALIGALYTSCKKEDDPAPTTTGGGTTTPALTYLIDKDSSTSSNVSHTTTVRKFTYNSSKRLIKVEYKYVPDLTYSNFDTLIYNSSGQLTSVINTVNGTSFGISYNGSAQITTVMEDGYDNSTSPSTLYTRVHTFTYTAGKITGMMSEYTSGANGNSNDTITNIVYSGNNIASLIYNNTPVTAETSTTAANPYYGLAFDPSDFINMINQNNLTKAYMTSDPTQILAQASYTYANGRVATVTENNKDNTGAPYTRMVYISYKGY